MFTTAADWGEDLQGPVTINTNIPIDGPLSDFDNASRAGSSVGLNRDGTTLVLGAEGGVYSIFEPNDTVRPGHVRVFTKQNDIWEEKQQIDIPNLVGNPPNDRFGASVAINALGTVLAIGSPAEDSDARGIHQSGEPEPLNNDNLMNAGAVYVYTLNLADDRSSEYQHLLSVKPGVEPRAGLEYGTEVSLSAGEGNSASLAVGAAGLFEIIPYNTTRMPAQVMIIAEDITLPIRGGALAIGVNQATPQNPVEVRLFLEGNSATISTNLLVFTSTDSQEITVEGVESGETKLTLVAITNDNAFLPATKEIIITITPDSLLVVDVMDPDDPFTLAEGSSRMITVRPELIDVATTVEVTVNNVEEGSGLRRDTLIIRVLQQHGKSEFNSGSANYFYIYR